MAAFESGEELCTTLDKMVALLQEDEAFKRRIAYADASVAFIVPELGAEYSLYFHRGEITGSAGGASETTIGVTLSAATLDRLLSGTLDGESAYTSGALRLRGNQWTAQTMAGYLGHIASAYKAASGRG